MRELGGQRARRGCGGGLPVGGVFGNYAGAGSDRSFWPPSCDIDGVLTRGILSAFEKTGEGRVGGVKVDSVSVESMANEKKVPHANIFAEEAAPLLNLWLLCKRLQKIERAK